ncbi:MAG: alpha/beta hydrolase [Actinomycetota bacterium]
MEPTLVDTTAGPLACRTSAGSGAPLVLIHGNSASGATWEHLLAGPVGQAHRCVAIDLPGHGASPPPASTEAYSLPGYAAAVAAVVEALGLGDEVALLGWSLGGHIALEALTVLPAARGVAIFGTPPLGMPPAMDQAFHPNEAMGVGFSDAVDDAAAALYAGSFLAPGSTYPLDDVIADILATDGAARLGLATSVGAGAFADEVALVESMSQPLAIIQGVQEQLVVTEYLQQLTAPTLWRGEVQLIDGAGHSPQLETPERFESLVAEFLGEL